MRGCWRWTVATGGVTLLATRGLGRPLESLDREHWVPLDLTATDQTTDVATGDGGSMVYISGYQLTPSGADGVPTIEALLMAYNSSGAQQWVVEYGSSGNDLGNSVAADSTGVYLAGTAGVQIVDKGEDDADDTDAFVVKYNSTGGLLWERTWGTSGPDQGNGVAVDAGSGLVYVVGTTRGSMGAEVLSEGEGEIVGGADDSGGDGDPEAASTAVNSGASDVFLTCLDAADGDIKWTVQFGSAAADVGNSVAVGPRGGVFLVGQLGDDDDASLAGARAFLAKYDYLGNSQFTARLNSSSTHYAIDLAPSFGSGGEGVVYMSGYTLGDDPTMFLARFEGSAGTQTWLSHFGSESGSPHLAQSVTVVEGSQDSMSGAGAGGNSGSASSGGPAAPGNPTVEDAATEVGSEARVVVVGYNTSGASAETHTSTGFTIAADTEGAWTWHAVSTKADRETAIAIGSANNNRVGGADAASAFIVGTVASSEASPGNYLFLDIQEVVRVAISTPAPVDISNQTLHPTVAVSDPIGAASATTGLSQGASLWLLIIAPILVVVSCILMVGYVSKQCSIAFGSGSHPDSNGGAIDYNYSDDQDLGEEGRASRGILALRRSESSASSSSAWRDGSPSNSGGTLGRRQRSSREGNGSGWPQSMAAAFRNTGPGPPYRKLGTGARGGVGVRSRDNGRRGNERGGCSSREDGEGGDVELHETNHRPSFGSARGAGSVAATGKNATDAESRDGPNESGAKSGEDGGSSSGSNGRRRSDRGLRVDTAGWESLGGKASSDEKTGSRNPDTPHGDEPSADGSPFPALPAPRTTARFV